MTGTGSPTGARDWHTLSPISGDDFRFPGGQVICPGQGGATLISGDLGAALDRLAPGAPILGLLAAEPDQGPFALRIGRDRALLITAMPLNAPLGWSAGHGISSADDLYTLLTLTGPGADMLRAACMEAPEGSASAMCLFGGSACLVTRRAGGFCVRVETPQAAALYERLRVLAHALGPDLQKETERS